MIAQASHIHRYAKLVLTPVVADREPNPLDGRYDYAGIGTTLKHFGKVQPMAIISGQCECGDKQAIDYGTRQAMTRLGQSIKQRRTAEAL